MHSAEQTGRQQEELPQGEIVLNLIAITSNIATDSGIEIGAVIAVVCSWQRNRSILWAILAGILSWIYVIYFALTRQPDERK